MSKQVMLTFPNEKTKDAFLGQVSDGAMEDICTIEELHLPRWYTYHDTPVYQVKMNYVDDTDDTPDALDTFDPEEYANHQYDEMNFGEEQDNDNE